MRSSNQEKTKRNRKQRHSSGQRCMKPCDRNVTERRLTLCSKLCFCKITVIFLNKTKYFSLNVPIDRVNRNERKETYIIWMSTIGRAFYNICLALFKFHRKLWKVSQRNRIAYSESHNRTRTEIEYDSKCF